MLIDYNLLLSCLTALQHVIQGTLIACVIQFSRMPNVRLRNCGNRALELRRRSDRPHPGR